MTPCDLGQRTLLRGSRHKDRPIAQASGSARSPRSDAAEPQALPRRRQSAGSPVGISESLSWAGSGFSEFSWSFSGAEADVGDLADALEGSAEEVFQAFSQLKGGQVEFVEWIEAPPAPSQ